MPDLPDRNAENQGKDLCIHISLQPMPSKMRASDGKDIPFTRAILMIRNICDAEAIDVVPHATLGQESGTVQDVSSSFSHSTTASVPPGENVSWDVYDLLLPAHPGTASKVHMFGYRAALNWRFDLKVWAEYRSTASAVTLQTSVSHWSLRWSVANSSTGEVELTIEDVKD